MGFGYVFRSMQYWSHFIISSHFKQAGYHYQRHRASSFRIRDKTKYKL